MHHTTTNHNTFNPPRRHAPSTSNRPPLFPARLLLYACLALITAATPQTRAAHPQDGPHADLRIAIEPDEVRFSIGINLAFFDTIAPEVPRETQGALSSVEARAVKQRLERFARQEVQVVIDGADADPVVLSHKMFTDPEPELATVYPNYGSRALIRSALILSYPVNNPEGPQHVEVTWPTYPVDRLAAELENLPEPPPMFLDVLLQAQGDDSLKRFTHVEPTLVWQASETPDAERYEPVPPPPAIVPTATRNRPAQANNNDDANNAPRTALVIILAAALPLTGVAGALALLRIPRFQPAAIAAVALTGAAASLIVGVRLALTPAPTPHATPIQDPPPTNNSLDQDRRAAVARALLVNLYRAFDFTDESEVYDALARSVDGELLESLYIQVFDSLIQAEQDGLLGIVTDLQPLEIQPTATPTEESPHAFTARIRWQVEGAVYHFGHAHVRLNEYQADFHIAPRDNAWKVTDTRFLAARRLDQPEGETRPYRGEL